MNELILICDDDTVCREIYQSNLAKAGFRSVLAADGRMALTILERFLQMGAPPDPNVFSLTPMEHYELAGADLVGGYALQLLWEDGHRYGLYTWEYLRGLCPCDECRGEEEIE